MPRARGGRRIGRHGYGHQQRPRHHWRRYGAPERRQHDLSLWSFGEASTHPSAATPGQTQRTVAQQ
ncbi:hypothetical protein ACFY5F_28785 [Streptomyces sp. NPDC013161]|uniref:hypothetical protein n=1 Tax=Streptomyces sp. NPDC013161 TaxID=3364862 RepID=UPI00367E734E